MKFNHQLQEKDAQEKARKMFQATKGKRLRSVSETISQSVVSFRLFFCSEQVLNNTHTTQVS